MAGGIDQGEGGGTQGVDSNSPNPPDPLRQIYFTKKVRPYSEQNEAASTEREIWMINQRGQLEKVLTTEFA